MTPTMGSVPAADPRDRPIAVFDSGVGGLTVLHELLVSLPQEDYVYLGDSARFPYGQRGAQEGDVGEVSLRGERDGHDHEGELGGEGEAGTGLHDALERAELGHVVEAGQHDQRDGDPCDGPRAHRGLRKRGGRTTVRRRQEHVRLIDQPADPDHDTEDVQEDAGERQAHRVSAASAAATSEKSVKKGSLRSASSSNGKASRSTSG